MTTVVADSLLGAAQAVNDPDADVRRRKEALGFQQRLAEQGSPLHGGSGTRREANGREHHRAANLSLMQDVWTNPASPKVSTGERDRQRLAEGRRQAAETKMTTDAEALAFRQRLAASAVSDVDVQRARLALLRAENAAKKALKLARRIEKYSQ